MQFRVVASPTTLKELERNMKLDRRCVLHLTMQTCMYGKTMAAKNTTDDLTAFIPGFCAT